MKVTIFMAISLDGFICDSNGKTPWSDAEWENYKSYLSRNDALIIGRRTYEEMSVSDEFTRLGNPKTIVVSSQKFETSSNITIVETPEDALKLCESERYSNVIVGGGQILNSYFIENNMATDLHLDIEPIIFGSGTALFRNSVQLTNLELINSETLISGCKSLDYRILEM